MLSYNKEKLKTAGILFVIFAVFTILVRVVDVQAIGPQGSSVGFASINGAVFNALGSNKFFYYLTQILGVVSLLLALLFVAMTIYQWKVRKKLSLVDRDLIALILFYVLLGVCYGLFEVIVVNYRPVLLDGLEASYPSSHTMLTVCIMSTGILQVQKRIQEPRGRAQVQWVMVLIIAIMVLGRLLSGVHWFTDIVGGVLLSAALIKLYCAFAGLGANRQKRTGKSQREAR